ncbi:MAG: YqaE/Pmp3 family membrane protein, partial [Flavobacteriales bacterium]
KNNKEKKVRKKEKMKVSDDQQKVKEKKTGVSHKQPTKNLYALNEQEFFNIKEPRKFNEKVIEKNEKKINVNNQEDEKIIKIVLSFFIPPLAVYMHNDAIDDQFWISVILTLLFFVPGVIYSLLVVTGNI